MQEAEEMLKVARERGSETGLPYFGALTPEETYALLQLNTAARLIDVRTRAEWDWIGRVPGSSLVEWQCYPEMQINENFLSDLANEVPDRNTPILFICRSAARSDLAARAATAAGYKICINVLEGFEGNRDNQGHRSSVGGWRVHDLPWIQS